MKISEIKIASFSDVHLGHRVMKTEHVIANLRKTFPDTDETGELDLILIPGDFFDRNLNLSDEVNYIIRPFLRDFLFMCKKRNIKVRVLKGTPSHDWEQSKLFTHINELFNIDVDVKYFNQLDIEYIDDFGIDVLYIPDEWRHTTKQTQNEVIALLADKHLEQVDFVVMHGSFKHQLPKVTHDKLQFHDADFYLSITRYFIFVGHIHFQSQFERILSSGSFDRSAHGEEKPKGHYRLIVRKTNQHDIYFVENRTALKFVTLNTTDLGSEEIYEKAIALAEKLPNGSHIRLLSRKENSANKPTCEQLSKLYPQHNWTDKVKTAKTQNVLAMVDERKNFTKVTISATNIEQLLISRIKSKHPNHLERCAYLLKGIVHE